MRMNSHGHYHQHHRGRVYRLAGRGLITKSHLGLLGNIIIGIVGSALGHYLAGVIGLAAYGPLARLAVGVGGAVLLIGILRFLGIM